MNNKIQLSVVLLALLGSHQTSFAQTDHSGPVWGTWTAAGNPHRLNNTVSVGAGQTLTIESGVVVEGRNVSFIVFGTLTVSEATLRDVRLSIAEGSAATISDTAFESRSTVNITSNTIGGATQPTFERCTVDVSSNFLFASGTSGPVIRDCDITTDGYGVRLAGTGAASVTDNEFHFRSEGNSSRSAIHITDAGTHSVTGNRVFDDPLRNDQPVRLEVASGSQLVFDNNQIITQPGTIGVRIAIDAFAMASSLSIAGNSFSNTIASERYGLLGTLTSDGRLPQAPGGVSYSIAGRITVNAGVTLDVDNGVTLFGSGQQLAVSGNLNGTDVTFHDVSLQYLDQSSGTLEQCLINGGSISCTSNTEAARSTPTFRMCWIQFPPQWAISVFGTAQPNIEENTIIAESCIRYLGSSGGRCVGNRFRMRGGSGVAASQSASPLIEGNVFEDDPNLRQIAINLAVDSGSTAIVRNNSICATGDDFPLAMQGSVFALDSQVTIENNTFPCSVPNGGTMIYGDVRQPSQLRPVDGNPNLILPDSLTIRADASLTIANDVRVIGRTGSRIFVTAGNLTVTDTELTSIDFHLSAEGQMTVDDSSIFDAPIIVQTGSHLTLRDSELRAPFHRLVTLQAGTSLLAERCTLADSTDAVHIASDDVNATVSECHFENNHHALRFDTDDAVFDAFPSQFSTSRSAGIPGKDTIFVPNVFDRSGTFPVSRLPFEIVSLTIELPATVTLPPGTAILASGEIRVLGQLVAAGTATSPIVFSTADVTGRRTWSGISFVDRNSATEASLVEHCIIDSAARGLFLTRSSFPIRSTTITECTAAIQLIDSHPEVVDATVFGNFTGVSCHSGSQPRIASSTILGNTSSGLTNVDTSVTIDAEENYWGDDSGPVVSSALPCDGVSNPGGRGDTIVGCVEFIPWTTVGPEILGTLTVISGAGQSGAVGELLPDPLVIEIRDLTGATLAGVEVRFTVLQGSAEVLGEQPVVTDANGRASAQVQLGDEVGDVVVAASARSVDSPLGRFNATAGGMAVFKIVGSPVRPGDFNADRHVDITDAILLLRALFDGSRAHLPCTGELAGAANTRLLDWNADGGLSGADAIAMLTYTFGDGEPHALGGECTQIVRCRPSCD